jgi:hypothetical protein
MWRQTYALRAFSRALFAGPKPAFASDSEGAAVGDHRLLMAVRGHLERPGSTSGLWRAVTVPSEAISPGDGVTGSLRDPRIRRQAQPWPEPSESVQSFGMSRHRRAGRLPSGSVRRCCCSRCCPALVVQAGRRAENEQHRHQRGQPEHRRGDHVGLGIRQGVLAAAVAEAEEHHNSENAERHRSPCRRPLRCQK